MADKMSLLMREEQFPFHEMVYRLTERKPKLHGNKSEIGLIWQPIE